MTIKITTPNGGSDSLDFGCAQTAIVATVTGTEVSSGEGKLELKTTTGGTSATKATILANGNVGIGVSPINNLQVHTSASSGGQIQIGNASTGATTGDGVVIGFDGSNDVIINNKEATQMKFYTSGTERMSINAAGDLKFNSGYGSAATAYGCRAWVNFNGTGTVAIREDGNVSSITDNGTGNYTVNFAVAMVDANYAVMGLASSTMTGRVAGVSPYFSGTYTTAATQFLVKDSADVTIDTVHVSIAILR